MRQGREYASSVVMKNGSLLILGGYNDGPLSTTELMEIDSDGAIIQSSSYGPDLPMPSYGHCSIIMSKTVEVILVGGSFAKKTHIYNLEFATWSEGPQLQDNGLRYYPACGQITDQGTSKK